MTESKNKRRKRDSIEVWFHKRNKALARVVEIWLHGEKTEGDLNRALDALSVAHTAATFEWGDGPLKW